MTSFIISAEGIDIQDIFTSNRESLNLYISSLKLENVQSKSVFKMKCKITLNLLSIDMIKLDQKKLIKKKPILCMLRNPEYLSSIFRNFLDTTTDISIINIFQTLYISYDLKWLDTGCFYSDIQYPVNDGYSDEFISTRRNKIKKECKLHFGTLMPNIITEKDIEYVAQRYFHYFLPHIKNNIEFSLTKACKLTTGKTKTIYNSKKSITTISINTNLIISSIKDSAQNAHVATCYSEKILTLDEDSFEETNEEIKEEIKEENIFKPIYNVCGIEVFDRISALQIILEHELCHYLIDSTRLRIINEGNKIYNEHGDFYKQVVYSYFRHTQITHKLTHNASSELINKITIGSKVKFLKKEKFRGSEDPDSFLVGIIKKINPKNYKILIDDQEELYVDPSLIVFIKS